MKVLHAFKLAVTCVACISMLTFIACGGDPTPSQTKQEEVTALLVGKTWKVQSVQVAGVDKTTDFTGMTISFTSTGFTVTSAGPTWPATGTWSFTNTEATTFKRSDDVEVQVEATSTSLKLTFNWTKTTLGPGRKNSVAGTHVFTFGL